mgnify:FL=1
MENIFGTIPKFESPEEELKFLREHVAKRESELAGSGERYSKEQIASEAINAYGRLDTSEVIPEHRQIPEEKSEAIVLALKPEPHDKQMEEFLGILIEHGVKNSLSTIARMHNPHLDADFHRLLVEFISKGNPVAGVKEGNELFKALHMKLYEVSLPEKGKENERSFKDIMNAMEQFYSGMQSVGNTGNMQHDYYTLEIALSNVSDEVVFYASVPQMKADLFEKQFLAAFPLGKVKQITDDYNIFNEKGGHAGSSATLSHSEVYPIKTYDEFEYDPLNTILNVFSKLSREGEGAAIQFVVVPQGERIVDRYNMILKKVKDGEKLKDAMNELGGFGSAFLKIGKDLITGKDSKDEKKIDEEAVKYITEKVKSTIMSVGIRIITSA